LKLNSIKTKVCVFEKTKDEFEWFIYTDTIDVVVKIYYLGFIITKTVTLN